MNNIQFQTGGFPLDAETIEFLQDAIASLQAIGKLGGDGNYVLSGAEFSESGADTIISDGWIFYNGELLPFVGGNLGEGYENQRELDITLIENVEQATYEDTVDKDAYFTRYFTLGDTGTVTIDFYTLARYRTKDSWYGKAYIPVGYGANQCVVTGDLISAQLVSSPSGGFVYRFSFQNIGSNKYVPVIELEGTNSVKTLNYNIKQVTPTFFDVLIKDPNQGRLATPIIYTFLIQINK